MQPELISEEAPLSEECPEYFWGLLRSLISLNHARRRLSPSSPHQREYDDKAKIVLRRLHKMHIAGVSVDEVAFDRVCVAVGLNADVAKLNSVKLMVRASPPMLELTRYQLEECPELKSGNFLVQSYAPVGDNLRDPSLAWECSLAVGVLGIWVPTSTMYDTRTATVHRFVC